MNGKKGPSWALVLSGGGAKGIAHVGVLAALEELGAPPPRLVVGTSMGSIVGGLYACGMKPAELRSFIEDFDIKRYLDGFAFQLPDNALSKVMRTGQIIGNLATRPGIDSGRRILETLERYSGGRRVDQTDIPFRCNAVDLLTGKEHVFDHGSMALAMRASMAVPGFFEPVAFEDMILADGGLADNMPVRIARELGFKRVLAVDVWAFRRIEPSALKTGPGILYRSFEIAVANADRGPAHRATFTLPVDDGTSALDFARARSLAELGRKRVYESERELRAFFGDGPIWALRRAFGGKGDGKQGSI